MDGMFCANYLSQYQKILSKTRLFGTGKYSKLGRTLYHQSINPQQVFGKCIIQRMANVTALTGTLRCVDILMLDGDLKLGPVTGTYYSLFQKEISNIPTLTPSLFNQIRRITRHIVSKCNKKRP